MLVEQTISDTVFTHSKFLEKAYDSVPSMAGDTHGAGLGDSTQLFQHLIKMQGDGFHLHEVVHGGGFGVFYWLFGMIAVFAFLRYYYPQALFGMLSLSGRGKLYRAKGEAKAASGILAPLFLFSNFIITMVLLVYAWFEQKGIVFYIQKDYWQVFLLLALIVIAYWVINLILSFVVGFLFDEVKMVSNHYQITAQTAYLTGLFLTPLLLFYYYTQSAFLLDVIVLIPFVFLFLKWFHLFNAGLTLRIYGPVHFFLYLCTVEILPLLLLLKEGIEQFRGV